MQDMLNVSPDLGAFISAPIKLAELISNQRRREKQISSNNDNNNNNNNNNKQHHQSKRQQLQLAPARSCHLLLLQHRNRKIATASNRTTPKLQLNHCLTFQNPLLLFAVLLVSWAPSELTCEASRHHAHYLDIVPSAHFRYAEGRQLSASASEQQAIELEARSAGGAQQSQVVAEQAPNSQVVVDSAATNQQQVNSHIYKRSSALISSAPNSHYPQLVSSSIAGNSNNHNSNQHHHRQNPLSRRMMAEAAQHSRWTAPQMMTSMISTNGNAAAELQVAEESQQQQQVLDVISSPSQLASNSDTINDANLNGSPMVESKGSGKGNTQKVTHSKRAQAEEAELLRQKQHIQYHDQWPSMAGKCHKRTLNFCASVLPFNTTTFPNIIGDTNRFEVKRSLPFFGFLAKSSCNKRLDELLCLLLEPPCSANSGLTLPPCKKFCRLALEGCNEYIPATLAMSSVFDCRQYPDSNDPNVCINLAQGSRCAADEFKCPDKTCIPRTWLCDGVRDCIFAADEANCTALSGVGQQSSVCSTEEFKCDGKCVPKAWKCDGERDCQDGSDEEACDQRPRCGPDRFKCADGNGCLPKRWVCDGKAECRDGSDELNCELRECSENDFKCDNGICIPKLWRCDRQADCKDASDERHCVYSNLTLAAATVPVLATTTAAPTTLTAEETQPEAQSPSAGLSISHHYAADNAAQVSANYYASGDSPVPVTQVHQQQQQQQLSASRQQQLESSLNDDISRIIQQESSSPMPPSSTSSSSSQSQSSLPDMMSSAADTQPPTQQQQPVSSNSIQVTDLPVVAAIPQRQSAKDLKKFDYDIIQSSSQPNLIQLNDLTVEQQQPQRQQQKANIQTQIDFAIPQQQQQQQLQQQVAQLVGAESQQPRNHLTNRERAFGQVIKTKSPTSEQLIMVEQQPQQQQQQQQQQQRVPIYRSLFKTLKGGQARLIAAQNGDHRYSMAVRRRRERHHQVSTSQAPLIISEEPSRVVVWSSSSSTPPDGTYAAGSSQPPQIINNNNNNNQTSTLISSSAQQAPRNHGVASYLQLLNNRYNLRLPRVSPLPPARS